MEIRDRIREGATELFIRLGIRSVSMDDIASQLGISKKTIYQYFADKDELVDSVVAADIRRMQEDCNNCFSKSGNAVEEIFLTMAMIQEQFRNLNPAILHDLQKFHFTSFGKFMQHKNSYLLDVIRKNMERGIAEGLYRTEVNVDVLSKYRLESMMIPFNMERFPPSQYNVADVTNEILEHFLFGMATEKGYQLILKYKSEKMNHGK